MTTVRGITSRVDIVWSRDGFQVEMIEGANIAMLNDTFAMYEAFYNIPLLSTTDDGRVYQCEVAINTSPPVMSNNNVTLDVIGNLEYINEFYLHINFPVPTPAISVTPSGPIQGAMVGSPQDIQCTVGTVNGVEPHLVLISWMGPGGDTITNDSRVTISPTSGSGNNYTSSLQFMYLMEGDEGIYTCSVVILETNASQYIQLQNLTGECIYIYACVLIIIIIIIV